MLRIYNVNPRLARSLEKKIKKIESQYEVKEKLEIKKLKQGLVLHFLE